MLYDSSYNRQVLELTQYILPGRVYYTQNINKSVSLKHCTNSLQVLEKLIYANQIQLNNITHIHKAVWDYYDIESLRNKKVTHVIRSHRITFLLPFATFQS